GTDFEDALVSHGWRDRRPADRSGDVKADGAGRLRKHTLALAQHGMEPGVGAAAAKDAQSWYQDQWILGRRCHGGDRCLAPEPVAGRDTAGRLLTCGGQCGVQILSATRTSDGKPDAPGASRG